MQLTLLKGKLHQATVTATELNYEGSCAIDADLLDAAHILPHEQVDIYNITNGERFTTYAITAERGSRIISIQGAAAHKATIGDKIIIAAFARMSESDAKSWIPHVTLLGNNNHIKQTRITQITHELSKNTKSSPNSLHTLHSPLAGESNSASAAPSDSVGGRDLAKTPHASTAPSGLVSATPPHPPSLRYGATRGGSEDVVAGHGSQTTGHSPNTPSPKEASNG